MAANTTVSRHNHQFYEGFVLLSGEATLITPWESQQLKTGSTVIFSPGTIHQWQTSEQACLFVVLSFDLDHLLATQRCQQWPVCPELIFIVTQLCSIINSSASGWQLRANGYLGVIYAHLLSLIEPPSDTIGADIETTTQLITRVDELLQANIGNSLTLEEIAVEVSMSARHLTRQFKAATGMTIHERLDTIRMERAGKLLRNTSMPVTEISRTIGISNAAYFANRFRRRFDVSPNEFRRLGDSK